MTTTARDLDIQQSNTATQPPASLCHPSIRCRAPRPCNPPLLSPANRTPNAAAIGRRPRLPSPLHSLVGLATGGRSNSIIA